MAVKRRYELDLLRVLACVMVVMVHTTAGRAWTHATVPSGDFTVLNAWAALQRACVPLFFMISGAMMLRRPRLDRGRLLRHNMGHLVVLYAVWGAFYALYTLYASDHRSAGGFLTTFVAGYEHLWYLPAMVAAYAVLPLVHALVHRLRVPTGWLAGVVGVYGALWLLMRLAPVHSATWTALTEKITPFQLLYVLYMWAGYWLDQRSFGRRTQVLAPLAFLAASAAGAWANLSHSVAAGHPTEWAFSYFSPMTIVQSVALFCLALSLRGWAPRNPAPLTTLTSCTLGIYLIHPFVRAVLQQVGVSERVMPLAVGVPVMALVTVLVSFVVAWVARRVAVVREAF